MNGIRLSSAVLAFAYIFFIPSSFAQWTGYGPGSSAGSSGGGGSIFRGFYLSVAAKGGLASIGSEDDTAVESRDAWSFGGELTMGVRAFGVLLGGSAEYLVLKQRKDPDDLDGTNASGTMVTIAPTLGIPFARFLFQVRPQFYSKLTLDKKTASGDEVEYSTPELPSYTAQLVYALGRSFIGVEYTSITYKKRSEGGEQETLENDEKLTIGTLGVVYGYKF